jgi:hypothetical protein
MGERKRFVQSMTAHFGSKVSRSGMYNLEPFNLISYHEALILPPAVNFMPFSSYDYFGYSEELKDS